MMDGPGDPEGTDTFGDAQNDDVKSTATDADIDGSGEGGSTASTKSANTVFPELPEIEEDDAPIDDDEFNIPSIDVEPSLESILNSDIDAHSFTEDDQTSTVQINGAKIPQLDNFNFAEGSDSISMMSKGSSDSRSRTSNMSARPRLHNVKKRPNSILRHVVLKGMTSHLTSAAEQLDAGTATAIAIGSNIAIGTSHGFVLVFDAMQSLRWCLGEAKNREDGGAVSSLAICEHRARLLVGYAKGLILMYDLESGKLIRTLTDVHAPATAVLVLKFTDYPVLQAICGDSGGSVFVLNFKRTMGVRGCDSRCIFSGSRGEVCTFEPLMLAGYPENPLSSYVIVALATLTKVIVVMVRPKLKVFFTHPLVSEPTTLPLLTWQMVIIQTSSNRKIVDPVLTFARGDSVFFYQATVGVNNHINFLPLQKLTVNYNLINLHWLNSRTLALLDSREQLHVLDVRSQEELESVDVSHSRLVYASSHFKGLATGGNVSKALALAGERACYNSVLCFNNQMLILGTKSVHALTMRAWHERLDYLVRQQYFTDALQLGYELYMEKAKAVVGLKGTKDSKRMIIREKLLIILDRYMDKLPMLNYMDDLATAKQNYTDMLSTCINYYVLLNDVDGVFGKCYELASLNPVSKIAYLESLEPFILNDKLRQMPPTIAKEFITHFEEIGNFKPLEACIVHINVEALDIHQTMKLCWTHGLYDAIIYIFNRGMYDFVSPLEELMTELQSALLAEKQLTDGQVALGNKILVYISCCLAGRAYPYGDIPLDLMEKVQSDVFRCITTLHSRNSSENEKAYPYLRTLLMFDTREFLNVLSLSFEEPLFRTELGKRQKQRVVDILLQVMVEQSNFPPTQVGILFTFLARQLAKPDNTLFVSNLLFEQVLEYLTSPADEARTEERQQALLELLQAGGMKHFDPEKLLEKSRKAKFFRVCEMLYERRREYDKIVECYLLDVARHHQLFSYLHKIFCNVPEKKNDFEKCIKTHLKEIVEIDNKRAAQVIQLHMSNSVTELANSLNSMKETQYLFLQGIFSIKEQNQTSISVDIVTTETYIELMCQFNQPLVASFLKSVDSYRPEVAMEKCRRYDVTEAVVYLLEEEGKISEAFDLMLNQFSQKLQNTIKECHTGEDVTSQIAWTQLQALFLVIIQFSQRNSPKMVNNEREKLWLPLLEAIISASNKFQSSEKNQSGLASSLNEMTRHLLSSMMGHVSLTTIVEIVMNDPMYAKATFAEIKDMILGMLETCTYEEMMVNLVKQITQSDAHEKLYTKVKYIKKGISPKNKICSYCNSYISHSNLSSDLESSIVVFHCGHSFHYKCCNSDYQGCRICRTSKPTSSKREESFDLPMSSATMRNSTSEEDDEDMFKTSTDFQLNLEVDFKADLQGKF